jgi:hypothetical protein
MRFHGVEYDVENTLIEFGCWKLKTNPSLLPTLDMHLTLRMDILRSGLLRLNKCAVDIKNGKIKYNRGTT